MEGFCLMMIANRRDVNKGEATVLKAEDTVLMREPNLASAAFGKAIDGAVRQTVLQAKDAEPVSVISGCGFPTRYPNASVRILEQRDDVPAADIPGGENASFVLVQ